MAHVQANELTLYAIASNAERTVENSKKLSPFDNDFRNYALVNNPHLKSFRFHKRTLRIHDIFFLTIRIY